MNVLFTKNCLSIGLSRFQDDSIQLIISSDYSESSRKSRLWVDGKHIAPYLETAWRSIRTRKLKDLKLFFDEIDYYDNMTDIYETPVISMGRGQRKARIGSHEHGSIPKDWSINLVATFEDTRTKTPIIEVIKQVLGYKFTPEMEKKLNKDIVPFLQKKVKYCSVYNDND
jgi:hypothetical protein